MKILIEKPPIWDEAHRHFEIDDSMTIYTWGDIIYNPAGIEIGGDLIAHENQHRLQQIRYQGGKEKWWDDYFDNPQFRADQEAQAYAAQYDYYCSQTKDRNERYRLLNILATSMSSPLYKLYLTKDACINLIRNCPILEDHSPTAPKTQLP